MFSIKIILLVLLLTVIACSQAIILPKGATWDWESTPGKYDSTNVLYDVFYKEVSDTTYALLDSVYVKDIYLLQYEMLYDNFACSTYVRARCWTGDYKGSVSLPSNIIYIWFPAIIDNAPYSFRTYNMEIPK